VKVWFGNFGMFILFNIYLYYSTRNATSNDATPALRNLEPRVRMGMVRMC
jgi:hypothetical protein